MKANTREADDRRSTIAKFILDGYSRRDIVQICTKKWGIGPRQIEKYMQQVNTEFKDSGRIDRELELKKAIERALRLYNECLREKDRRTASSVLKELNELLGLKSLKIDALGEINITFKNKSQKDYETDSNG